MPLVRRSLLKVRMGRCNRDGKKVVPDTRRGDLELLEVPGRIGVAVEWRERGSNKPEVELVVLPGETRVRCINKGVFLLEYVASADRKYFFWTQETESTDEDCVAKLTKALNPPSLSGSDEHHGGTNHQTNLRSLPSECALVRLSHRAAHLVWRCTCTACGKNVRAFEVSSLNFYSAAAPAVAVPKVAPAAASTPKQVPAAAAKGGAVQIADLQSILSSLGAGESSDARRAADLQLLVDVLNFEALFPVISGDPATFEERLKAFFPPELQQSGELYDVLRSPQFRQALESFHSALVSGHLQMSLFRELNLDLNSIGARPSSESFLRAIRAPPKTEEKPPSKMDTS